jgi:hypothetical protein
LGLEEEGEEEIGINYITFSEISIRFSKQNALSSRAAQTARHLTSGGWFSTIGEIFQSEPDWRCLRDSG